MNNNNKVETAMAGLNCWASYATADGRLQRTIKTKRFGWNGRANSQ